jgi:hypothetical protein
MKYFVALAISFLPLCQACACDRDLTGTWKSDKDMSMAFIRETTKLQPKTGAFLEALLGNMTLTFTDAEVRLAMPDTKVPVAGELRPFAGFKEQKPYTVLFCSTAMIVWSAKRSFSNEEEATTFNFDGPDTIWVYTGSTAPGAPDLHTREYFRRSR